LTTSYWTHGDTSIFIRVRLAPIFSTLFHRSLPRGSRPSQQISINGHSRLEHRRDRLPGCGPRLFACKGRARLSNSSSPLSLLEIIRPIQRPAAKPPTFFFSSDLWRSGRYLAYLHTRVERISGAAQGRESAAESERRAGGGTRRMKERGDQAGGENEDDSATRVLPQDD